MTPLYYILRYPDEAYYLLALLFVSLWGLRLLWTIGRDLYGWWQYRRWNKRMEAQMRSKHHA